VANIIRNLPNDIQNAMIAYYGARNPIRPAMEKISLILNYLSAGNVTLRELKPLGITRRIDEDRALQMIGTMAQLFRNLKYRGLCVLFDEAEAIHSLSRIDQQEGAYENLLRIVTETATFPYCYFVYSTTPSFFDAYSRFWPHKYWISPKMIHELSPMSDEEKIAVGQKLLSVYSSAYGEAATHHLGPEVDKIIKAASSTYIRIGDYVRAIIATLDEARNAAK
jgi:hypothetical protein